MNFTIHSLLGEGAFLGAVADRALARFRDEIILTNYLSFLKTDSESFKSVYGQTYAARMGSVIDPNSGKPIRGRRSVGKATLEVIYMADTFQMDNHRLNEFRMLVQSLNKNGISVNEVADSISEDFKEITLAPYKRTEKILLDLLFTGKSSVKLEDNPKGVEVVDMAIPIHMEKATTSDKGNLIGFLMDVRNRYQYLDFDRIEMSNNTFIKYFAKNPEFVGKYKVSNGGTEVEITGTVPLSAVNAMLAALGLPEIRVVSAVVTDLNDKITPLCPDDRIVFLPKGEIGKLRHFETYEEADGIPTISYTSLRGNHLIGSERTKEGRNLEYICSWVPEVRVPKNILSVDISATMKG